MALKFDDEKPELNITPLVDIMLVLLAILMVTMPTLVYQEDIALPDGSKTKTSTAKQKDLIVYVMFVLKSLKNVGFNKVALETNG